LNTKRLTIRILLTVTTVYFLCIGALEFAEPEPAFGHIPPEAGMAALPRDFLLGAATSAHQVEGGNRNNDWASLEGVKAGASADHWNRVGSDISLLQNLGANSYRFSIEWSRVEPEEGQWDNNAWDHYADEVNQLNTAGIRPMVTLLHFTLPRWLAAKGGLTAESFPDHFARFAAEAGRRLGAGVALWCTVNEPNVHMYQSYVSGAWPPGIEDTTQASLAFAGLVRAHTAASAALREHDPGSEVGVAMNLILFEPQRHWWALDWVAANEADKGFNWAFYDSIARGSISFHLAGFPEIEEPLEGLAGSVNYFGINYYRRNLVRFTPSAPGLVTLIQGPGKLSDSGVEIYPEGLLRMIRRVWRRYELPVFVTENGVADASGNIRPDFLRSHLYAVSQAVEEGIPVRGYFHWSLMDNYEWAEGYTYRFGLYGVDFDSFERIPGVAVDEFRRLSGVLRRNAN